MLINFDNPMKCPKCSTTYPAGNYAVPVGNESDKPADVVPYCRACAVVWIGANVGVLAVSTST